MHFAAAEEALEGYCWPFGAMWGTFGRIGWGVGGSSLGCFATVGGKDGRVGFDDTDGCGGSKLADVGGNQCFRSDRTLRDQEFGVVVSSSLCHI